MASRLAARSLASARLSLRPAAYSTARGAATGAWPPRTSTPAAKPKPAPPHASITTDADAVAAALADAAADVRAAAPPAAQQQLADGGSDPFAPPNGAAAPLPDADGTDWSKSYHGLSAAPFPREAADVLLAPIDPQDVEMKPGA